VLSRLEAACAVDLYTGQAGIPRDELLQRVQGKQALMCLLTDRVDQELIDAGNNLRIVANIAVGYNNIDLAACQACGIVVTNTPDVLTNAFTDFAWGLIIAVRGIWVRRSVSCGAARGRAGRRPMSGWNRGSARPWSASASEPSPEGTVPA
jgi:lactate dehydrogenase-like 2-hydroxyacid dehydrogenase